MRTPLLPLLGAVLLLDLSGFAATRYVNLNNATPSAPYATWVTAATKIQDAVDAAVDGDLILVTNGLYQTGARAVYGMSNRVAVTRAVTVQSVNGPAVTTIAGYRVPGTTYGAAAVRCVYLTNGAVVAGFTLTNGATQTAGDAYLNGSGGGAWSETAGAVLTNCVLTGSSAYFYGGGVYSCTLNNCTLTGNSAINAGGGASDGTLNNCTLTGNSATGYSGDGGGAAGGTLNNCVLTGNWANESGGGVNGSTLNNCAVTGNWANRFGGGAKYGTLNNCIVYYNTARLRANNYEGCTLNYSCTTPFATNGSGNFIDEPQLASFSHVGAGSPCRNAGSLAYAAGLDIDGEPWGAPPSVGCDEYWSASATGALSAAIQATYTNVAVGFGVDFQALIGGRVSASRWDFGDGFVVSNRPYAGHAWSTPGNYVVELRAYNGGNPSGVAASVTVQVLPQPVHYVSATGLNPVAPYTNWAKAATRIQQAVDASTLPGALVLVSNGVYQTGAQAVYGMSNRVAVTKAVTVQSANGAAVTTIVGYQVPGTTNGAAAVRCVYLTNGAVLAGFTLTNGATQTAGDDYLNRSGGGAWSETAGAVLTNCVLTGNSAYSYGGGVYSCTLNNCTLTGNSAYAIGGGAFYGALNNCTLTGNWANNYGGGTYDGVLNNCVLTGNSASRGGGSAFGTLNGCTLAGNSAIGTSAYGGGSLQGTLNNCTLTGNWSDYLGGGAYYGVLNNCIVYFNAGPGLLPNYSGSVLNYSCATPLPSGPGNIASDPLFVDPNAWSNLRLQPNSPCVNAGNNGYVTWTYDLDSQPRISGGTVDMGAYEFQGDGLSGFSAWLWQYGLSTDGSADYADTDQDGMNNWQEWVAGTNPTNAASVLQMLTPLVTPPGIQLRWSSVTNRFYTLERATNLASAPTFSVLRSNIAGLNGVTPWTDTNAAGSPRFYRVLVEQ
jgi:hypothetical protein